MTILETNKREREIVFITTHISRIFRVVFLSNKIDVIQDDWGKITAEDRAVTSKTKGFALFERKF